MRSLEWGQLTNRRTVKYRDPGMVTFLTHSSESHLQVVGQTTDQANETARTTEHYVDYFIIKNLLSPQRCLAQELE